MADIRLKQSPTVISLGYPPFGGAIDFSVDPNTGGLDETQALATAVVIALGTDGLAFDSDELPDNLSTDRKGWWGDMDAASIWSGWAIGSRLWTKARSSITFAGSRRGSTLAEIVNMANNALQPFVDNQVISSYKVVGTALESGRGITLDITIFRSLSPAVSLLYDVLWDEQRLSAQAEISN
jgi:phage gp46-like protein